MAKRIVLVTISLAIVGEILSDLYLIFTTGTEYLLPLFFRLLITVSLVWLIFTGRTWARWVLLILIVNNLAFAGVTLWESFSYLQALNSFCLGILLVCELSTAILILFSNSINSYIQAR